MYIFSFFLCAVALLLVAFSLHLLFTHQGNNIINRLLGLALMSKFWQVCVLLFIISPYRQFFPIFYSINIPFLVVAPAFSYLYVRYFISDEKRFQKRDFLHFIPLLLVLFLILPFGQSINWDHIANGILQDGQVFASEKIGVLPVGVYNIGIAALWLGYLIALWQYIIKSNIFKKQWNAGKIWIIFYASMSTFFRLLPFVALFLSDIKISYIKSPLFLILSSAVILFMILFVLYQPQILYGYIIVSNPKGEVDFDEKEERGPTTKENQISEKHYIYNDIIQKFIEENQPFLNPTFQMKDLATAVDIPVHHCSYVINYLVGKNFRDWVNAYRIDYFIKEYPQSAERMTIEAVAFQSGFRNTATFYNAFKKETGKIPAAYFKEI